MPSSGYLPKSLANVPARQWRSRENIRQPAKTGTVRFISREIDTMVFFHYKTITSLQAGKAGTRSRQCPQNGLPEPVFSSQRDRVPVSSLCIGFPQRSVIPHLLDGRSQGRHISGRHDDGLVRLKNIAHAESA